MIDCDTNKPVTITFDHTDWISSNLIGLSGNEDCVDSLTERPWSEVPDLYNANSHCMKFYRIQLSGGSSVDIISYPYEIS